MVRKSTYPSSPRSPYATRRESVRSRFGSSRLSSSSSSQQPSKMIKISWVNKLVMAFAAVTCFSGLKMTTLVLQESSSLSSSSSLRGSGRALSIEEDDTSTTTTTTNTLLTLQQESASIFEASSKQQETPMEATASSKKVEEKPIEQPKKEVVFIKPLLSKQLDETMVKEEKPAVEVKPVAVEVKPSVPKDPQQQPQHVEVPVITVQQPQQQPQQHNQDLPVITTVQTPTAQSEAVVETKPEPVVVVVKEEKPSMKETATQVEIESQAQPAVSASGGEQHKQQRAIIHMGLLSADSAVIKETMHRQLNALQQDGYELPGPGMYLPRTDDKAPELGFCFYDRETYTWAGDGDCAQDQMDEISKIKERGSSIVLSSDNFAVPFIDIQKVKDTMAQFEETKVIAYYTRFYEYVYGIWEQLEGKKDAPFRKSFVEWSDFTRVDQEYRGGYTLPAIFRWENVFKKDQIELYNMYDPEHNDLATTFFCNGIPDATKTCEAVKNDPVSKTPERVLIYEDMAYYAKNELGLLQDWTWEVSDLARVAQQHQQNELKRSLYDFPAEFVTCPDERVLKSMLEKSLHTEKHLFKKYYRTTGETEIRQAFEQDSKGKLCHINAKAVLERNEEWRNFFQNLGSPSSSSN